MTYTVEGQDVFDAVTQAGPTLEQCEATRNWEAIASYPKLGGYCGGLPNQRKTSVGRMRIPQLHPDGEATKVRK